MRVGVRARCADEALPLVLEGDVDEDTVLEWKKEFFGEDEAEQDDPRDRAASDGLRRRVRRYYEFMWLYLHGNSSLEERDDYLKNLTKQSQALAAAKREAQEQRVRDRTYRQLYVRRSTAVLVKNSFTAVIKSFFERKYLHAI